MGEIILIISCVCRSFCPSLWFFAQMLYLNPEYWNSNTLATWCEELTHWKRSGCWERLKVGGEGDVRGWDGWMVSLTWWTWVWVSSGSWWWAESPSLGVYGLQRVGHSWVTELTDWLTIINFTQPYEGEAQCSLRVQKSPLDSLIQTKKHSEIQQSIKPLV